MDRRKIVAMVFIYKLIHNEIECDLKENIIAARRPRGRTRLSNYFDESKYPGVGPIAKTMKLINTHSMIFANAENTYQLNEKVVYYIETTEILLSSKTRSHSIYALSDKGPESKCNNTKSFFFFFVEWTFILSIKKSTALMAELIWPAKYLLHN